MANPEVSLRPLRRSEINALREIYRSSVSAVASTFYSPEQIASWIQFADSEEFEDWIIQSETTVAIDVDIIAFGSLKNTGYVSAIYVADAFQRQGVGSMLLRHIIGAASERDITRLWTHASEFSKGLFEKHGFHLVEVEVAKRRGATFDRYVMELTIN